MNVSSETRCDPVRRDAHVAPSRRALLRRFTRDAFVGDDHQRVAGRRNVGKPHDFDRNRRSGFLDLFALVVDQRANLAERAADDDDVADAQRAVLHEHGRDRAAAAVERRFDDDAGCAAILVGFEIARSASSRTVSSSLSMPSPVRAETGTISILPPHSTGCRPFFGELLLDAIGLGVFFVHLVDGDDDRHVGRVDVGDRFFGLRHHAVVGRDHEDRDVGDFRAARAHRGKRFVTGRIDERDLAIVLSTVYAPIFCVMPPASPPATLARRILSSSEVLPWST